MPILINAYERGVLYGRCDAQCYDGKHEGCHCVCKGRNHGLGFVAALANTAANAAQWERVDREQRRSRRIVFETPLLRQPGLFP